MQGITNLIYFFIGNLGLLAYDALGYAKEYLILICNSGLIIAVTTILLKPQ